MDVKRPPTAERIREARNKADLSAKEVAEQMELGISAYDDLETYDDEVFTCISLNQLRTLSELLSIRPIDIVANNPNELNSDTLSVEQLVECINNNILENSESVEEFYDRAGWDISSALSHPENVCKDWNLDELMDICEIVGVNWSDVLKI